MKILNDPQIHIFILSSIILNITFIFGIWKIGITLISLSVSALFIVKHFNSQIIIKPHKDLSILITGTSTGIGKECVDYLSQKGFHIFAGQRNIDNLKNTDLITYLKLDVDSQESVDLAIENIKKSKKKLFALINNAGITCNHKY
jgi:hypothetical protein